MTMESRFSGASPMRAPDVRLKIEAAPKGDRTVSPDAQEQRSSEEKSLGSRAFLKGLADLEKRPPVREARYQRQGFLADGDLIQDQQIFVSDHEDHYEFQCRLSPELFKKIQRKFDGLALQRGKIAYDKPDAEGKVDFCDARVLSLGESQVKVFDPSPLKSPKKWFDRILGAGLLGGMLDLRPIYTAGRTVSIEIKKNPVYAQNPEKLFAELQSLMKDFLDVENIEPPSEMEEKKQRVDAYAYNQNISPEKVSAEERARVESSVVREEVFPGYHAMVDHGRAERHLEDVPFVLTHHIAGVLNMKRCRGIVSSIVKGGGLLSRAERYARGIDSPSYIDPDMVTGGGDSVFVTLYEKNPKKKALQETSSAYFFVIDPAETDRLDWYGYHGDTFGTKAALEFNRRDGADAFIKERQHGRNRQYSEIMFPHGVPLKSLLAVTCKTEKDRQDLIVHLREDGIEEINGKPVEDFVVVVGNSVWDRVDLGMERRKKYDT